MILIALVAPDGQRCGIADYVRLHAPHMPGDVSIRHIALPATTAPEREWRAAAAETQGCDLVHLHFEAALFAPIKPYRNRFLRWMRRLPPRRLVTLHDDFPTLSPRWRQQQNYGPRDLLRDLAYLPFYRGWEARLYRAANHYIVHTGGLFERTLAQVGAQAVSRLPMPVPAPELPARWQFRSSFGSPLRLITPGFVKAHKGLDLIPALLRDRPAWTWVIAGGPQDADDAACLDSLLAAAEREGVADRLRVTGYLSREAIEAELCQASLAVFPFRRCPGSSSIAWAMALGVPITASDIAPIRELEGEGAGIALMDCASRYWTSHLDDLLANQKQLALLSERNCRLAASRSFAAAAERLAVIYRRMVAA